MTRLNRRVPHRGDVITGYVGLVLAVLLATGAMTWIAVAVWLLYRLVSKL